MNEIYDYIWMKYMITMNEIYDYKWMKYMIIHEWNIWL